MSGNHMRCLLPVIAAVCFPCLVAHAGSAGKLIDRGNAAYAGGNYDEALSAYEEASVAAPESDVVFFNNGAAYYRKGDYEKAVDAFEKAALKTRDVSLEARAKFNLGNCAYRESERQRDSDLKKSLAACEQSIAHYRAALKLKPDYREAAENIEIVRLVMKSILDEIKKQEEAAKKDEDQQKAAEKLKELIERQQAAADRSGAITEERTKSGDSPETQKHIDGAREEQEQIRQETETLSQGLTPPPQQASPGQQQTQTLDKVKEHLSNAGLEQKDAVEKLTQADTETAQGSQTRATDELKKALEAMSGGQGQGQQPDQQAQQEQNEKQEGQSGSEAQKPDEQDQQEQARQALAPLQDQAKDILDEEKENKERRQQPMSGGYRQVDKDW